MAQIISSEDFDPIYTRVVDTALRVLGYAGNAIVELESVDEEEIRRLNREYRGKDKVTDVLSFGYLTNISSNKTLSRNNYPNEYIDELGGIMLGSIIICPSVVDKQATEYGNTSSYERLYLFVHGVLHLLGYDHELEADRREMRRVEKEILEKINE